MWGAGAFSARSLRATALSALLIAACTAGCSSSTGGVVVGGASGSSGDDTGPADSSIDSTQGSDALADAEASTLARLDGLAPDAHGDSTAPEGGQAADVWQPDGGSEAGPGNEAGADVTTGEGSEGAAGEETGAPPTSMQDASDDTQSFADDGSSAFEEGGSTEDGSANDASDAAPFPVVTLVPPCTSAMATGSTLFDLGHGSQVSVLKQSGNRLLSEDTSGHWVLWNLTSKLPVLTGDAPSDPVNNPAVPQLSGVQNSTLQPGVFSVDLAGSTMAVASAASIALLSALDGHALATIPIDNTVVGVYGLASDGSYLWVGGQGGLQAYTTAGAFVVNRTSGDYTYADVYAAPGTLEVGGSPAGDLELISIATGVSQVPLRANTLPNGFGTWFTDGSRFVTSVFNNGGTIITVYSSGGTKVSQTTLAQNVQQVGGFGPVYWTSSNNGQGTAPQVFAVSGGANPVWTEASQNDASSPIFAAGGLLAFSDSGSTLFHVLNLTSITVRDTDVDLGAIGLFNSNPGTVGLFDADASGNWAFTDGSTGSLVFDGADAVGPSGPVPLDCGAVQAIAGGAGGRVAIATAAGQVLFADLSTTARTLLGALGFPATGLAISDDGSVLAASGLTLRIFDLPNGSNPVTLDAESSDLFALARGGGTLGVVAAEGTVFAGTELERRLYNASTGALLLNDSIIAAQSGSIAPLALSPSGLAAITDFTLNPASAQATTSIFRNGTVVGTANGYPVGWLDDARLVVNSFGSPDAGPSNFVSFSGANICDTTGRVVAPLPVPVELQTLTPVGSTQFYDPSSDAIYNLDGGVAWTGPPGANVGLGDVAGPFVVVAMDHRVVLEQRP